MQRGIIIFHTSLVMYMLLGVVLTLCGYLNTYITDIMSFSLMVFLGLVLIADKLPYIGRPLGVWLWKPRTTEYNNGQEQDEEHEQDEDPK